MNNKIFLKLTILILSLAFLVSCSRASEKNSRIIVGVPASPLSLDPRVAIDAEGEKILSLICDGLVYRDDEMELKPNIAENYEKINDTSFRFFLRPNVKFHDGSMLTAEDIVFTYMSVMEGKIASPLKSRYEIISNIVAESPEIVRVDLKAPYAPFLSLFTRGIVSKAAAQKKGESFGWEPVCTGPYKIKVFKPDSKLELEKNPDYFGELPKNSEIEFQVIKDDNIRVLKLIKGDVDLVQNAIPVKILDRALKNKSLDKKEDTSVLMTYMGFNLSDPVLSKLKVRKAIAHAIDRDEIIGHKLGGLAQKANSIMSPGNWAYNDHLDQYDFDPEKAKKLLDEAGFRDPDGDGPKKRFKLIYKTSTNKDRIEIANMIATYLEKVGIAVDVRPYEWGKFYNDVRNGNFQIYTLQWVGVMDPDIFYDVCHSSQMPPVGLNRDRYSNARVDKLVEEGRVTLDQGKREKFYSEVQKILLDELPYLPLWHEKNVVVYNKDLSGVSLRPDAGYRVFMNVEK